MGQNFKINEYGEIIDNNDSDYEKALKDGKLLLATKLYAKSTGCSLKEAKNHIDKISSKQNKGCSILLLVFLSINLISFFIN